MKWSLKVLAPAALLIAGLAVSSAEAAPAGAGLVPLQSAAADTGTVAEKTRWVRKCYRSYYGVRCRRVWVAPRHYRPHKHHRHHHHRHHRRYR